MDFMQRAYNYVFYERADPRVKDWFLMTSPIPLMIIGTTYLVTVKLVLPAYMRTRKPYHLTTFIKWYNIIQIVGNAVATWGILTSGWTTSYRLVCILPDYSTNPEPMRMLNFLWWTLILKLLEIVETVMFVLRKRDRQVSVLHVYHHMSTPVVVWMSVKYVGGGIASFPPLINNATHVLMYSYYLASVEGSPRLKAVLIKYKKWITVIQMVQFSLMIIYCSQVFLPSCPAPLGVTYLYFPNVIFVYYMFYKFYKQNYKCTSYERSNGHGKVNKIQ